MRNPDLLTTLSGCKFYHDYLSVQQEAAPAAKPARKVVRRDPRVARQLFRKHALLAGILLLGSLALVVAPLWATFPPYGRAVLLSVPPMALCALSWMAGATWAWHRDRYMLTAVTVGAMPLRIALVLGWALLVRSIPDVSFFVFMLGMMWHWIVFTFPEVVMLLELTRKAQALETRHKKRKTIRRSNTRSDSPSSAPVRVYASRGPAGALRRRSKQMA